MNEENNATSEGGTSTINNNRALAALAYFGPLLVVSYILGNNNPYVKFHLRQGLVLLVIEAGIWLVGVFLFSPFIFGLLGLIRLAVAVFAIIGIINAVQGKEKELPWLGQFAKYFTL